MRTISHCKTAAGLLTALAIMAIPSFAGDKMSGHKMDKMGGKSKMSGHKMDKKDDGDAAVWKKGMMSVGNADRSTMAKMSAAEKAVVIKLLKK